MNIKRAFLAASAAVMLPGLAMAQLAPTTFPTTVDFSNDFDGIVTVTLTCNTGTPLVQSFDISEGSGVDFVVQELDIAAATSACDITMDGLAEGYTSDTVCSFGSVEPAVPLAESNPCEFQAFPLPSTLLVTKTWEGAGPDVDTASTHTFSCTNAAFFDGDEFTTISLTFTIPGPVTDAPFEFYTDPDATSSCTVIEDESMLDSAVETDQGCSTPILYTGAGGTGSCTIANTVFYEGIPTLSQYGMAIMALLMLGVGFVGFRRFV
jgi:hypothetical protein